MSNDQERIDDAEWRLSNPDRYHNFAGYVGSAEWPNGREKAYECMRCEGVFTETADRMKDRAHRESYYRAVLPIAVMPCHCGID